MKKMNIIVLAIVIAILLSIAVFSQLSPIIDTVSNVDQLTPTISLEETNTCTTSFYNEIQGIYGNCTHYLNITSCLNTSGKNTDCSVSQEVINYQCKTGEVTATKNRTECKPNNEFIISIDKGTAVLKQQINYSEWGPCIYNVENTCLIVTCVSNDDGAFKGQFTDCKGGKSCQRFEICDNSIKTLYKNSREDFVEDDPSFYLSALALGEVPK
ncbi:hypothetical protein J4234_04095 [Candidatus Woesearchaeota archaeon]|nr:hypothetical protein [Candidatus Woesearchaeota archaeon]